MRSAAGTVALETWPLAGTAWSRTVASFGSALHLASIRLLDSDRRGKKSEKKNALNVQVYSVLNKWIEQG